MSASRARAKARGLGNVEFVEGDLRSVDPGELFDAVVGRLVLMYVADPATALRAIAGHLVPGGILALMEINWRPESFLSHPPVPLWGQVWDWMCETVERAGVQMNMGFELHRCFLEAGLPGPEMLPQAKVVPGTDTGPAHTPLTRSGGCCR